MWSGSLPKKGKCWKRTVLHPPLSGWPGVALDGAWAEGCAVTHGIKRVLQDRAGDKAQMQRGKRSWKLDNLGSYCDYKWLRAALLTWKRSVQVLPHGLELRSGPTPDPALSKRRDGHAEKPTEGGFWGTSIHFHRLPLKAPCYFFLESFSGVS